MVSSNTLTIIIVTTSLLFLLITIGITNNPSHTEITNVEKIYEKIPPEIIFGGNKSEKFTDIFSYDTLKYIESKFCNSWPNTRTLPYRELKDLVLVPDIDIQNFKNVEWQWDYICFPADQELNFKVDKDYYLYYALNNVWEFSKGGVIIINPEKCLCFSPINNSLIFIPKNSQVTFTKSSDPILCFLGHKKFMGTSQPT